jgi:putative ABC transport system permease protein
LLFLSQDFKITGGIFILGILLLMTIGLYPAFLFSSFTSSKILKNGKEKLNTISTLKSAMILVQFSVTTALIIGILLISKQLNFIQNKDLGFQKENIIYTPFNGVAEHYNSFKQDLLKNPSVVNVSAKNSLPIESADKTNDIYWPNKDPQQDVLMEATGVDFNYIETMGLNMDKGKSC